MIAETLPPDLIIPFATAINNGPQPATTVDWPGRTYWDFNSIVEAARPITPGIVQPGKGIIRSSAPLAIISDLACHELNPFGPTVLTTRSDETDHTRCLNKAVRLLFFNIFLCFSPSRNSSDLNEFCG